MESSVLNAETGLSQTDGEVVDKDLMECDPCTSTETLGNISFQNYVTKIIANETCNSVFSKIDGERINNFFSNLFTINMNSFIK